MPRMASAEDRILQFPLAADGAAVRSRRRDYFVASVSDGMNDVDEYACLFAGSPDLLVSLRSFVALIEEMRLTGALFIAKEAERLDEEIGRARKAIATATENWKPNPWDAK